MTARYQGPTLLASHHTVEDFTCRSVEQTDWLRRFAHQSNSTGTTKVFVVCEPGKERVIAYYAWCMAQIAVVEAPVRARRGAGRYPQPIALLARLGVDVTHEGNGLGAGLLRDVILRLLGIEASIGCRGLVIHCESQAARAFSLHLVPELDASPTDDLHLVLLMKDARKTAAR